MTFAELLDLRGLEEALGIAGVDSLGGDVPASMMGVASVSACVDARLIKLLNLLILKALFDLKQLLRNGVFCGVADRTNTTVPGGTLSAEEVPVDLMFNSGDHLFDLLVVGVVVFLPPREAGLVTPVVCLTVMN